jgi:glucan phosphoethanolaminetransferase (alkaline phosphatase superfamily)
LVWLAIPLSVLLGDFVFRWGMRAPANLGESPSNLLASMGLSFVLWWAVARLVAASEQRWLWASAVAIPAALLCASAWHFRQVAGHDPSASMLVYFWQQPASSMNMVVSRVSVFFVIGSLALCASWIFALASGPKTLPPPLRRSCLAALLPWVFAASLWPAGMTVGQTPFVVDFHLTHSTLQAAKQILGGQAASPLGVADRADLPDQDATTKRPNVIVVVAESLRRDRMQIYGHARATTPRMANFFGAHPDATYRFDQAASASAYTQLAVPTILSGLYMAHGRETMHRAPLVWHYAQALGAQTFLVSPQQWSWQGLDDFLLLDSPPEHLITAETMGADIVNDVGVHDRLATDRLVELIDQKLDPTRPFLGVVQTNSTHFPFLAKEDVDWKQETIRDVYDAAVALTDEAFGGMIDALSERELLDETVIIFVSDHAEFFYEVGVEDREQIQKVWQDGLRISSCHPAILRIPMFVYIPEKWRERLSLDQDALRTNQHRQVSTVDVVATILDLWQLDGLGEDAGVEPLDGHSLFSPIAKDRAAFCFNSASWNLRDGSGFSAFDSTRAIYGRTGFEHLHTYDPTEAKTWTERHAGAPATAEDLAWLEAVVDRAPFVRAYLDHIELGPGR